METEQTNPLVLLVEKAVVKEKLQMLVVILNVLVVLVALKVLRFVRQRVLHFH